MSAGGPGGGRVFQLIDTLWDGAGVGHVARGFVPVLAGLGADPRIVVGGAARSDGAGTVPVDDIRWQASDTVILHFYGYTRLQRFLETFPGRVVLYFENVTPPTWFRPGTALRRQTVAGWTQVPRIAELADVWAAPSAWSLDELAAIAPVRRRRHVVPPVVSAADERARPADAARLAALRARGETNVLFVGRLVPHKAQARVMEVFEHFHRREPRSRLHLVGSPSDDPSYARALATYRERLQARDAIELPGHVDDRALAAYYRAADLFLCLSRHEGFCLPPIVAAAHGVPVLARAEAAIPETVGPAALLLHDDDPARIAALMQLVREEPETRARLAAAAARHLARFEPAAVAEAWREALA